MVIAKRNEPKMTKVKSKMSDRTRFKFDRYLTPRPTNENAEIIDKNMIKTRR